MHPKVQNLFFWKNKFVRLFKEGNKDKDGKNIQNSYEKREIITNTEEIKYVYKWYTQVTLW